MYEYLKILRFDYLINDVVYFSDSNNNANE
jgi:hypothetical protein